MTKHEMAEVSGVFEHLSPWMLSVFANTNNSKEIVELAKNEILVKRIKFSKKHERVARENIQRFA